MSASEDLQRDEEFAATPESAAAAAVDAKLKDVHTNFPGIVKSFDRAKMTVTVQPAIKRIWVEHGPVDLPLCVDVPVMFPGGGGCHLVFDVAPGNECVMHVSERAIDFWYARGGTQEPSDHRFFDLSDCFASVGVCSASKVMSAPVASGGAELRTDDGGTVVRVESGMVYLGEKAASFHPLMLDSAALSWLTTVGGFCGAGPFPSTGIASKVKVK